MNNLELSYLVFRETQGMVEFRDMLPQGGIRLENRDGNGFIDRENFARQYIARRSSSAKADLEHHPHIYLNPGYPLNNPNPADKEYHYRILEKNVQVMAHELLHIAGWFLAPLAEPEDQEGWDEDPDGQNAQIEANAQHLYRFNLSPIPRIRRDMKAMLRYARKDSGEPTYEFKNDCIYCNGRDIASSPYKSIRNKGSPILQLQLFL